MLRKPGFWMVAGVVLAVIIVAGLAIRDAKVHKSPEEHRAEDARAFMATWKKSRYVAYKTEQTFQRFRQGRVVIETAITFAQDPPRQASISGSNIELILKDRTISCSRPETDLSCAERAVIDWDDRIKKEVDALDGYFFSPSPIYQVTEEKGGCFRLDNIYLSYPSPPYGLKARFCFDSSFRPTKREVFREAARDLLVSSSFSKPNDEDFAVPKEAQ